MQQGRNAEAHEIPASPPGSRLANLCNSEYSAANRGGLPRAGPSPLSAALISDEIFRFPCDHSKKPWARTLIVPFGGQAT